MTRSQISELKRDFIEQQQAYMRKHISSVERKLYNDIFTKIINKLELEEGGVVSNGKNLNIAAEIDGIYREFNKTEYTNIIRKFSGDLSKIATMNADYFSTVIDKNAAKRFNGTKNQVKSFMAKRIGLNSNNEIVKDGYLDRLVKDESLKNSIKDKIIRGITNKTPVDKLIETLQKTIIGNPDVDGGLVKHFNQNMHDTYNQFDRTTSKIFAEKLDLKFFVYQGGKIKSSREFCIQRDNKCFTTQEAEQWKMLVGKEDGPKADKNDYNPLVDCGGYNCRHSIDYISDSLARRYRPEMFN